MTTQIQLQEQLAQRVLALSSFRRLFAQEPMANTGYAVRGRRRFRQSAVKLFVAQGYTEEQARLLVKDAIDYARLLYSAEG